MNNKSLRQLFVAAVGTTLISAVAIADDVDALIGAVLGDTPVIDDLKALTDQIGGRVTGSPANEAAVSWAVERWMPYQWRELEASARVSGDASFLARIVAKPFSTATDGSLKAPLVDGGFGTQADFERLGNGVKNAWVLVETPVLDDDIGLSGLFAEYNDTAVTMPLAIDAGVAGVVFVSSRLKPLLQYRPAGGLEFESSLGE
jgi:hypothetical protein